MEILLRLKSMLSIALSFSLSDSVRLLTDIVMFMKKIEEENFVKRLLRQDIHKHKLEKYDKLLSEAMKQLNVGFCGFYELSVADRL